MNENKENTCERSVEGRMPKLSQDHITLVENEASIKWVHGLINYYRVGDVHTENGATLQIVSEQKVRCIRIFDDPGVWYTLSIIKGKFKHANIEFEIDPFVIITPVKQIVPGAKEDVGGDKMTKLDESVEMSMKKEASQSSSDNYGMEVV